MSVQNVRVDYIRPRYKNLKEWCEDPNNVYIGRGGVVFVDGVRYPPVASPLANPFKISPVLPREEALARYGIYIRGKMKDPNFVDYLRSLKGKNLGCWCVPAEKCHGEILLEIINGL